MAVLRRELLKLALIASPDLWKSPVGRSTAVQCLLRLTVKFQTRILLPVETLLQLPLEDIFFPALDVWQRHVTYIRI